MEKYCVNINYKGASEEHSSLRNENLVTVFAQPIKENPALRNPRSTWRITV